MHTMMHTLDNGVSLSHMACATNELYHQAEGKTDTTTATTSYQALATHSIKFRSS